MPPLPAMRISSGREPRAENHKRGRSVDRGMIYREKEDDLALFNEVQNRERENFLLQSNNDLDDIFSTKLRYFSEYKLGISVPAQGESSGLLKMEGDKNDYDWLITPPETPLFPSLDDETPSISLASRGRPRNQPSSISQSSMMDQHYGSCRGSASPHRMSPSSQFGNKSTLQSITKPFTTTHSSPPPTLRHPTSSRRPSPPPSKSSTPAPRSSTPTPRRMSTGSAGVSTPSRVRGTSPINTSRGNSASPKIRAWHSNIPGFSLEAPPNLRTSLADRPASYVRGSSPASRNGSRSQQSMSPTASRSVSSSHSHDRDPFSSNIKGSVASSGDDDRDSLQSISIGSSDHSAPRSIGSFPNNRAKGFSKKPTKIMSTSAPKRSFDLAQRQMDRKGPQNMFRPLLSSVPTSTFYVGKTSAYHCSMVSRNSSITTSSNASSDLGTSGLHDTDGSEQNQEDVTSSCVKVQYPDVHDEFFVMDPAETLVEDVENRTVEESSGSRHGETDDHSIVNSHLDVPASFSQLDPGTAMDSTPFVLDTKFDCSDADGTKHISSCSKCGCMFDSVDMVKEGDQQICLECQSLEVNSTIIVPLTTVMVGENTGEDFVQILNCGSLKGLNQSMSIPESLQVTGSGKVEGDHLYNISKKGQCLNSVPIHNLSMALMEEEEQSVATEQVLGQPVPDDNSHQQFQQVGVNLISKVNVSEGAGVSFLLKRSSNEKGLVIQSRSFTASHTSYDDFSHVRDNASSMKNYTGHGTASVSSSVDLGTSRHIETLIHQQSGVLNSDVDNCRSEMPSKHKGSVSSLSGASSHVFQVLNVMSRSHEEILEVIAVNGEMEAGEATNIDPSEQSLAFECNEAKSPCCDFEINDIHHNKSEEVSNHLMMVQSVESSMESVLTSEAPTSSDNGDKSTNNYGNSMNVETSSQTLGEDASPNSRADRVDVAEVPNPSFLNAILESDIVEADTVSADSQSDGDLTNSKSCTNELMELSGLLSHNDDVANAEELDISNPALCVHAEESTIMLDDLGGVKARSLTLEEATDSILFCTSIVHNLAYQAANIAIEKEQPEVEVLKPTLTLVDVSRSDRRDIRSRNTGKRSSRSQKDRQNRLETETKPISFNSESDEKYTPRVIGAPNRSDGTNPPKLESKCNCRIM